MLATTKLNKRLQRNATIDKETNEMLNQAHQEETSSASLPVEFKLRQREFPLVSKPLRVLAAPDLNEDPLATSLIDWAPQSNPLSLKPIFAVALDNQIYIQDIQGKNPTPFTTIDSLHGSKITSLNFDRSGEALVVGDENGLISIYDVNKAQRVRSFRAHTAKVNAVSWNRSVVCPYLISTGGSDFLLQNHDVRVRDSVINMVVGHQGELSALSWSANHSPDMMRLSDPTKVMLASGSAQDASLGIWRLSDLNCGSEGRLGVRDAHFWHSQVQSTPL